MRRGWSGGIAGGAGPAASAGDHQKCSPLFRRGTGALGNHIESLHVEFTAERSEAREVLLPTPADDERAYVRYREEKIPCLSICLIRS